MYLHLGQDCIVKTSEILGIFDLDKSSTSRDTREFLRRAESEGRVVNVSPELPKSFLVRATKPCTVYICQISAATLKKRSGFLGQTVEPIKNLP